MATLSPDTRPEDEKIHEYIHPKDEEMWEVPQVRLPFKSEAAGRIIKQIFEREGLIVPPGASNRRRSKIQESRNLLADQLLRGRKSVVEIKYEKPLSITTSDPADDEPGAKGGHKIYKEMEPLQLLEDGTLILDGEQLSALKERRQARGPGDSTGNNLTGPMNGEAWRHAPRITNEEYRQLNYAYYPGLNPEVLQEIPVQFRAAAMLHALRARAGFSNDGGHMSGTGLYSVLHARIMKKNAQAGKWDQQEIPSAHRLQQMEDGERSIPPGIFDDLCEVLNADALERKVFRQQVVARLQAYPLEKEPPEEERVEYDWGHKAQRKRARLQTEELIRSMEPPVQALIKSYNHGNDIVTHGLTLSTLKRIAQDAALEPDVYRDLLYTRLPELHPWWKIPDHEIQENPTLPLRLILSACTDMSDLTQAHLARLVPGFHDLGDSTLKTVRSDKLERLIEVFKASSDELPPGYRWFDDSLEQRLHAASELAQKPPGFTSRRQFKPTRTFVQSGSGDGVAADEPTGYQFTMRDALEMAINQAFQKGARVDLKELDHIIMQLSDQRYHINVALAACRAAMGLTPGEAAEKMDVTKRYYQDIEGKKDITSATVQRVSDVLALPEVLRDYLGTVLARSAQAHSERIADVKENRFNISLSSNRHDEADGAAVTAAPAEVSAPQAAPPQDAPVITLDPPPAADAAAAAAVPAADTPPSADTPPASEPASEASFHRKVGSKTPRRKTAAADELSDAPAEKELLTIKALGVLTDALPKRAKTHGVPGMQLVHLVQATADVLSAKLGDAAYGHAVDSQLPKHMKHLRDLLGASYGTHALTRMMNGINSALDDCVADIRAGGRRR